MARVRLKRGAERRDRHAAARGTRKYDATAPNESLVMKTMAPLVLHAMPRRLRCTHGIAISGLAVSAASDASPLCAYRHDEVYICLAAIRLESEERLTSHAADGQPPAGA